MSSVKETKLLEALELVARHGGHGGDTVSKMLEGSSARMAGSKGGKMSMFTKFQVFCALAAIDPAVFKTFKRHPDYTPILCHVTEAQGHAYLEHIKREYPALLNLMWKFKENDALGSPLTYDYADYGYVCPTTLRYIKVAGDIEQMFGSWEGKSIFELGAGYGGQCKIMTDIYKPNGYTIVDLPGVCVLTRVYLQRLHVDNIWVRYPGAQFVDRYDLFISNYAFSELDRSVQQDYIDKVMANSAHGYVICNFLDIDGARPYTREELMCKLPNKCKVSPELPNTDSRNCLITW